MAEIGALHAALSANAAQFEKDMGRARNAVRTNAKEMERAMDGVRRKFGEAMGALNLYGGMAATVAAGGLAAFIKQQINAADAIGKMAQQTGTSAEFLSSMGFVAEQSGTKMETLAKGIQRLSMNMNDFRRGVGESKEAFEDLGLVVENENGTLRNSEEVLLDIAERFKSLEDGADKTAMAMRLFGRAGAELIPMLNQGRDGIEELQSKAQEMGLVISTETAMQAAFLNDQLNELKNQAVGVGRNIAVNMLPDLNEALQVIRFAKEESGFLTAAWVALGAAGSAVFGKSLKQQINEIDAQLEKLQKRAERTRGNLPGISVLDPKESKIDELIAERKKLQDQLDRESEHERKRMEASYRRSQEEAERRSAATEALRTAAAERAKIEQEQARGEQVEKTRVQTIEATIAALEQQGETYGMNAGEVALYRLEVLGASEAEKERARELWAAVEAQEKQNAQQAKAKQIFEATRTPAEQFREQVAELNELYEAGAISVETYWRAIEQAWDGISEKTKDTKKDFSDLQRAIEGWGRDSSAALSDFAMSGKASFGDLINSMISDLLRMMIYQKVMGPLFAGVSEWAGGGSFSEGAASFAGVSEWAGGGSSSEGAASFGGKRARGGPVSSGSFYEVNENGPELLNVGGRQFLMMGDQSGHVTPHGSGGGGVEQVKVEVYNESGQPVRARQASSTVDGKRMVVSMFLEAVEDNTMGINEVLGRR